MRQPPTLIRRSSYAHILATGPVAQARRVSLLSSSRILSSLLVGAILLIGAQPSHADEVILHGGRKITGTVISGSDLKAGDPVVIQLESGGQVKVAATDVLRIERTSTPAAELADREKKLRPGSAHAAYELAVWARKHGLAEDATRLFWRALELYPQHKGAREALGFRRLGALWLTEDDYQRAHGKVQFDGKWLTREEYLVALRNEDAQKLTSAHDLLRTASGRADRSEREAALTQFRQMTAKAQACALVKASESKRSRQRQFAVREFGVLGDQSFRSRLAFIAVSDSKKSVRDEALKVLKEWNHKDTALSFIPYVDSGDPRQRVNAVRSLNVFPDRRAAGAIIDRASQIYGSFGRVHFANVVQRAYVKDYELVSGGTGLVVQEVADPVIDTMNTGVVLDIDIRRVEIVSLIATLGRITGERYGSNIPKWKEWWAEQTGREQKAS